MLNGRIYCGWHSTRSIMSANRSTIETSVVSAPAAALASSAVTWRYVRYVGHAHARAVLAVVGLRMPPPRTNTNVLPRERVIVKVSKTEDPRSFRVQDAGRSALQRLKRNTLPTVIVEAVARDGFAYALAYSDRDGRWHPETIVARQKW
jgi:hypothetical protein